MTKKIIHITKNMRYDMTGQQWGHWTVIGYVGNDAQGQPLWLCRCSCGKERPVVGSHLRNGTSASCGCQCLRYTIHGYTKFPEYEVWRHMIERCQDSKRKDWPRYGGRGIVVCQRWRDSFPAFYEDMGPRPTPAHSIDRINNDGNYEPGNCRWATVAEQASNKSNNRYLTFDGQTLTVSQWARKLGIKVDVLNLRLSHYNWTVERALTQPVRARRWGKKPRHTNSST